MNPFESYRAALDEVRNSPENQATNNEETYTPTNICSPTDTLIEFQFQLEDLHELTKDIDDEITREDLIWDFISTVPRTILYEALKTFPNLEMIQTIFALMPSLEMVRALQENPLINQDFWETAFEYANYNQSKLEIFIITRVLDDTSINNAIATSIENNFWIDDSVINALKNFDGISNENLINLIRYVGDRGYRLLDNPNFHDLEPILELYFQNNDLNLLQTLLNRASSDTITKILLNNPREITVQFAFAPLNFMLAENWTDQHEQILLSQEVNQDHIELRLAQNSTKSSTLNQLLNRSAPSLRLVGELLSNTNIDLDRRVQYFEQHILYTTEGTRYPNWTEKIVELTTSFPTNLEIGVVIDQAMPGTLWRILGIKAGDRDSTNNNTNTDNIIETQLTQDPALRFMQHISTAIFLNSNMNHEQVREAKLYVSRYLYFSGVENYSPEIAQEAWNHIQEQRERYQNIELFRSRSIIALVSDENWENEDPALQTPRFNREEFFNGVRSQGYRSLRIFSGLEAEEMPATHSELSQRERTRNNQTELETNLINAAPPLTFIFRGHGGTEDIYYHNSQSYNSDWLANIIQLRHEKWGSTINNDIYMLIGCYQSNNLRNISIILQRNNIPCPIFIGAAEQNLYSYSNDASYSSGLFRRLANPQNGAATLGDIYNEHLIDSASNPVIYVPSTDSSIGIEQISQTIQTNTEDNAAA